MPQTTIYISKKPTNCYSGFFTLREVAFHILESANEVENTNFKLLHNNLY